MFTCTCRQAEDAGWSLQRQLHVRSAYHLPNHTSHTSHARLPVDGVTLHPVAKLDALYPDGASNIGTVGPDHGSQQESSLEEADGSDQDEETGQTGLLRALVYIDHKIWWKID